MSINVAKLQIQNGGINITGGADRINSTKNMKSVKKMNTSKPSVSYKRQVPTLDGNGLGGKLNIYA